MTPDILLVLGILIIVIAVLITEIIALEVLALLVLGTLAVTGLVSPSEALSGFSNPAVVTIWAVFILSGGLTRTGIANILGRYLLKMAGGTITRMMIMIMMIAGILSAFMNNVAVAALMLPVVMDICRKTKISPTLLLMPLAYGSLLGGLTTMIGTPPNILVSEALRSNGLKPFSLFDFTPVGLCVMAGGVMFITLFAPRILPVKRATGGGEESDQKNLAQYHIEERLFRIAIPTTSSLVGITLASSHLGSHLGLNVVGIRRKGKKILAPTGNERIEAGDELIVEGHPDRVTEINNWGQLLAEEKEPRMNQLFTEGMAVAEHPIASNSGFIGETISDLNFRNRHNLNILAVVRNNRTIKEKIKLLRLRENDTLLVHGTAEAIKGLQSSCGNIAEQEKHNSLVEKLRFEESVRLFRVPDNSNLIGKSLSQSRLGDALDIQILTIVRQDGKPEIPSSSTIFRKGDRLVISGMPNLIASLLLQGLEAFFIKETEERENLSILEDDRYGIIEVILSPHSTLSGQTLQELRFREKYGLSVLAVWRKGTAIRTGLRDLQLQFGDALLLYGSWKQMAVLGNEPDFIVLTEDVQEAVREEKAKTALTIMAAVLLPVIFGWVPIYISVVMGAAVMVMSKCLTMDEAYRYIEWKAVFLIAGMLPLGNALDSSGAASLVAEKTIALLGPFGPYGVLFGLLVITFAATSIIPTAALVVLMVPIALETSSGLGISPYPLMMGIAMAASSSFTSPISHPANVLVMGPGGYKFIDYVRLGVPLTLLILIILMLTIPLFWPMAG